jgi:hypothetical protein
MILSLWYRDIFYVKIVAIKSSVLYIDCVDGGSINGSEHPCIAASVNLHG